MSVRSCFRRTACGSCTPLRFRPSAGKTTLSQSARRHLQSTSVQQHVPAAVRSSTVTAPTPPTTLPASTNLDQQIATATAALQSALATQPQPQRYTLHCIQQLITLYKASNQHARALHYVNQLWKQYTAAGAATQTSADPHTPTVKTLGIRFNAAVLPYNEQPTNLPLAFNRRYHNYSNLVTFCLQQCRLEGNYTLLYRLICKLPAELDANGRLFAYGLQLLVDSGRSHDVLSILQKRMTNEQHQPTLPLLTVHLHALSQHAEAETFERLKPYVSQQLALATDELADTSRSATRLSDDVRDMIIAGIRVAGRCDDWETAAHLWQWMKQQNIAPTHQLYETFIDIAPDSNVIMTLLHNMTQLSPALPPTSSVYRVAISRCHHLDDAAAVQRLQQAAADGGVDLADDQQDAVEGLFALHQTPIETVTQYELLSADQKQDVAASDAGAVISAYLQLSNTAAASRVYDTHFNKTSTADADIVHARQSAYQLQRFDGFDRLYNTITPSTQLAPHMLKVRLLSQQSATPAELTDLCRISLRDAPALQLNAGWLWCEVLRAMLHLGYTKEAWRKFRSIPRTELHAGEPVFNNITPAYCAYYIMLEGLVQSGIALTEQQRVRDAKRSCATTESLYCLDALTAAELPANVTFHSPIGNNLEAEYMSLSQLKKAHALVQRAVEERVIDRSNEHMQDAIDTALALQTATPDRPLRDADIAELTSSIGDILVVMRHRMRGVEMAPSKGVGRMLSEALSKLVG